MRSKTNHFNSKKCFSNGNTPKMNTFVYNDMLRKTTNGVSTSKVMSSPQTSAKAIWVPKHLLINSKGSNKSWVPKYAQVVDVGTWW